MTIIDSVSITDLSPDCRIPLADDVSAIVFIMDPIPSILLVNCTPKPPASSSVGTISILNTICFITLPNIVNKLVISRIMNHYNYVLHVIHV